MLSYQENFIFKFNGSYSLDEEGWRKVSESDSELVNTIVLGREEEIYPWVKTENLDSSILSGLYRVFSNSKKESEKLLRTHFINSSRDFELTVKFRIPKLDTDYINHNSEVIGGYSFAGISPIRAHFDKYFIELELGYYLGNKALVISTEDRIVGHIFYNWDIANFEEIKLKSRGNFFYIYINDSYSYENWLETFESSESEDFKFSILFESSRIKNNEFGNETILDIDSLLFQTIEEFEPNSFEANDIFYSDKDSISFELFNGREGVDGYTDGYDGYDGYVISPSSDDFIFIADKYKYIYDIRHPNSDRMRLFKDGKGFLNYEIINKNNVHRLATNVKSFSENELHHVATSWSMDNINGDELRLFIDGEEAPNLIKFGSNVNQIYLDKFSDVEKERLQNFANDNILFESDYTASTTVSTNELNFLDYTVKDSDLGRGVIIKSTALYPTLVGQYLIIIKINGNSVTLADPITYEEFIIGVSASDLVVTFAPITKEDYDIKTDIEYSKFSVNNGENELGIVIYKIENNSVSIVSSDEISKIEARVNLTTKRIEFVKRDEDCIYVPSVELTDKEVFIQSYGLSIENINKVVEVSSSTFKIDSENRYGSDYSSIKTALPQPIDMDLVSIKKIVIDKFIPSVSLLSNHMNYYKTNFSESSSEYLSSESIQTVKTNEGRRINLVFDSDNFYHDEVNGAIVNKNIIKVTGVTKDGSGFEEFEITRNGTYQGEKLFESVTGIEGVLNIIDLDEEPCLLQVIERDNITGPDDKYAKIFDFSSGEFFFGYKSSETYLAYELPIGKYIFNYGTKLQIRGFDLDDTIHIGSDYLKKNLAKSTLEEFKVIGEEYEDQRPKFTDSRQRKSISEEYLAPRPICPDKTTFGLIPFNNPFDSQLTKLKKERFIDRENNTSFKLEKSDLEVLSRYLNDEANFIAYLTRIGVLFEDAKIAYYEVHKASNGPIKNISKYYPASNFFYRFTSIGPNSNFEGSGKFDQGKQIEINNDQVLINPNEATIEFWVSPLIDTLSDNKKRTYFDARDIVEEIITSDGSGKLNLSQGASEVLSVNLLSVKSGVESDIYDELLRNELTGILDRGTGVNSDFSLNYSFNGNKEILLKEKLLTVNNKVRVRYIPVSSSGDYIHIFKDEFSNFNLEFKTNGNLKTVKQKIRWTANSWHKIIFSFNKSEKSVYTIIDGINYNKAIKHNIHFKDILNKIQIGGFNSLLCMSRIANFRISSVTREINKNLSGSIIDPNYSSILKDNNPVIEDEFTTLLIDFDDNLNIEKEFSTIIDPVNGIFNFDVNIDDGFKKLDYDLEILIEDLIAKLKPAHTNAVVNINKDRC